jgi:hypothetical protein
MRALPGALLSLLLLPLGLSASTARSIPFEQKVEEAEAIVVGKVLSSESRYDASGRWIVTETTFAVEKALKGRPAPRFTVVTPGGSVDGIHQVTIGVPEFRPGDERVVFVRSQRDGSAGVLYFEQGAYTISGDGSRRLVEPATSDLVLVDPQTGRAVSQSEPARSLADFERLVERTQREVQRRQTFSTTDVDEEVPAADRLAELRELLEENRLILVLILIGFALALIPLFRRRG